MSSIGGEAPMVLGVLWTLTAVTFVFVLLRVYTRLKVLDAYGIDDHFFNIAFVSKTKRGVAVLAVSGRRG